MPEPVNNARILVGIRLPVWVDDAVEEYIADHGIGKGEFIVSAILEKLEIDNPQTTPPETPQPVTTPVRKLTAPEFEEPA